MAEPKPLDCGEKIDDVEHGKVNSVSEKTLEEFTMMFKQFDKDQSGKLSLKNFESCVRALGFDLPIMDEGQIKSEFEAILKIVDPNKNGYVSFQDYITYMIYKEKYEEIKNAFRAMTVAEELNVTQAQPYSVRQWKIGRECEYEQSV